ncbi:MAG: lysophospholipase L1-like esterase [Paraglaciecola sp.]|jgi:lysophospholipase L1-like esterase
MRQQILYFLWLFLFSPFMPLLYWQSKKVKKNLIRLPEADILVGKEGSQKESLSILVFGESSFAGVGVAANLEGIAGNLAQQLYQKTKQSIYWQVIAKSGYNAQRAAKELTLEIPTDLQFDAIFVGLGANEAFEINAPLTFRKNLQLCIQEIRKRQPTCPIFLSDLPPAGQFPALPFFLKKLMHGLIELHADVIQDFPKMFPNLHYDNGRIRLKEWRQKASEYKPIEAFFCEDGVHPSKLTYQIWGEELAKMATKKWLNVKKMGKNNPYTF